MYARATAGTASYSPSSWFFTELILSFSELTAPMSMLFEMLSRCPRNFSHGPAIEMWSVVHFPFTLIRILAPCKAESSPYLSEGAANATKGCRAFNVYCQLL